MKIIIVGGGQIGSYITSLLLKNDHEVRVIENRTKALENYKNAGLPEECLVIGDGTDIEVLEKAGVRTCQALVCVTGLDEVNLTTAMLAKFEYGVFRVIEYDVPRIIARVNNPKNAWLFNSGMGVDAKINQADIIGHMIADEMNYQSIMTLMKLSKGDFSIVRIRVDYQSRYAGKQISEISLPNNALLIAIYNDDELMIPHGDTLIEAGQDILAFGDEQAIGKLNEIFVS